MVERIETANNVSLRNNLAGNHLPGEAFTVEECRRELDRVSEVIARLDLADGWMFERGRLLINLIDARTGAVR